MEIGEKFIDRYTIESFLGEGGTALVYKAVHELMRRQVAIKVLKTNFDTHVQETLQQRLQQEARAAGQLAHPNLTTVYDFGITESNQPYIIMDFLSGLSISDLIKKEGAMPWQRVVHMAKQVCDGLYFAHKRGIIHRDIKPNNIISLPQPEDPDFVKVVDFGIAKFLESEPEAPKLTKAGQIFGSPYYMSPEQCLCKPSDARSDIYALGITLFEMLTGLPPFRGGSLVDVIAAHLHDSPPSMKETNPKVEVPPLVEEAIRKALSKEPDQRFKDMDEFGKALEKAIAKPAEKAAAIAPTAPKIRMVAADSDKKRLDEITKYCTKETDIELVGTAGSGEQLIDLVMQMMPNVVLSCTELTGMDALSSVAEIRQTMRSARIMLYTPKELETQAALSLCEKADGFLGAYSTQFIGPAARTVVNGSRWIAEKYLKLALDKFMKVAEDDHRKAKVDVQSTTLYPVNTKLNHAQFLRDLGKAYLADNKLDEAEGLFHGSWSLMDRSGQKDNPDMADVWGALADIYERKKKYPACEQMWLGCLKLNSQVHGSVSMKVAETLRNLARVRNLMDKPAEAVTCMRWALSIHERNGDIDSKQYLELRNSMKELERKLNPVDLSCTVMDVSLK